MKRAVLIGCGSRAPWYLAAYRLIPDAEVVACCDRSGIGSHHLADAYGIRAYQDVGRLLAAEQPELVHIVTGPAGRVELMEDVAAHDVPLCTVEKPVALGVADYRRLSRLVSVASTKFAVSHQFRWQPDYDGIRRAVLGGDIGRVTLLDLSAGMTIAGQGTHVLHYGLELIGGGPVVSVFGTAHGWTRQDPEHPGPIASSAVFHCENGVRGLWVTGSEAPRVGKQMAVWKHVRIAAYGEAGHALYEEFGRFHVWGHAGRHGGDYGGMETWRQNNIAAQAGFHQAMWHWQGHPDDPPSTNLRRSLDEWKVVLAVYYSALVRRPVRLSEFEPDDGLLAEFEARFSP